MSMKNPLTPAGIEPVTFRFVAQHLNHCATAVPILQCTQINLINTATRSATFSATCITVVPELFLEIDFFSGLNLVCVTDQCL